MQKFEPIFQNLISGFELECEELKDSKAGLEILLRNEEGKQLRVIFSEHLAYRLLDEGDALETLHQLNASDNKGSRFYLVEPSEFMEWFHKQSYGIREDDGLKHYMIVAQNDIIDVIAFAAPSLYWE